MNNKIKTVAHLKNVTHRYNNNTLALDDVTISIPAGMMVGLLGPDGVGKSTLMGLISGARKLQQGNLTVLDDNMALARHRELIGPHIAYMPQGLGKNLYAELSVEENLDFFAKLFNQPADERKLRIETLTKATELHAFLSRSVKKLSGGMKQKLGLCCSLIHDPDLLILDEPTTGVDPLSRRQFWQLITSIRAERPTMSVLVSTAYMDEAEGFDYLIAMDAGHVLDTGTPQEIKARTNTDDLESAFIRLLPQQKRANHNELIIPPFVQNKTEPAIVAKNLSRCFDDFIAVNNVSFEIQEGEIFGFLGSNGCGKTTTMKMLTGLLAASSGEAYLFGKPVDANDIKIRQRVGFMSQAFSLYGELTVSQNLTLHARLFHLSPAKKTQQRIETLVKRFNLHTYMNEPAASLPLGMRQRLSLAVAVIHEPEMLILDEPTSGVDPIARDQFWQLLVELSRTDKVTIFVSTHFMNEALRCDRISLMHAGEVLIYGTPKQLIEKKKVDTLEQAFIGYLEDAIKLKKHTDDFQESSITEETQALPSVSTASSSDTDNKHFTRFSFYRLLAYSYLESMQMLRDPIRLAFAFIGSAILLMVIAYGISLDVDDLNYATFDNDRTPESRQYLSNFEGSRYFITRPPVQSNSELEQRLRSNDIALAIEIPAGFGRDLKSGKTPSVSAWIDGSNTIRASTIEGYVTGVHIHYITELANNAGIDAAALTNVTLASRYRYNPSFKTVYSMGPKTPAMLLLLFPAILMAVSISREKEIGTITNFYVTPTNKLEFLLGKQLPYIGIGMLNFLILTFMVVFLLKVPLLGSFFGLMLGALCYVFAATGFGLLIATITQSQVASIFATAILCMLPTLEFSGIVQPTSTLEGAGHFIGTFWPATYYMHLSVAAFTKGLGFFDLVKDIIILAMFGPVFIAIAAIFLKKQER